ncbi:MAG: AAA family ATPase [Clostridia bacterium]|nr:AAA family ATPase [Clostridia bacterium]
MDYTFDNIAGFEVEKKELMRLCEIFNNREKYESKGASMPKGIIFFGEPGNGKTLFSKVMANVCGLEVFKIDLGDVEDDVKICRHIRKAFLKAGKRSEPTMVFFDEMDKVLPSADDNYCTDRSKTILTQLLTLIDGMESSNNIVFVATCNDYDSLPEALIRPGRLDKKIGIGFPDYSSRVAILNMYASKSSCKFESSFEDMAKLTSGFSSAGLKTLINECVLSSDDSGFIGESVVRDKFYEISNEDIPRKQPKSDAKIRACKNVGSYLVGKFINGGGTILNLNDDASVYNNHFDDILSGVRSDDDYDEYYDDCDADDEDDCNSGEYCAKNDYLGVVISLLGGYVAEELILNKVYDNMSQSIRMVDLIMVRMANCGMFGLDVYYSSNRNSDFPFKEDRIAKLNEIFDVTVKECYEKAKFILENNKDALKKLVSELVKREVLKIEESEEIIASFGGIK